MDTPSEMTKIEKPPVFNRSRLLKMAGIAVACFAVLGMLINYGGKSKGKPQAAAAQTAPNVKVPDFGDYRSRAGAASAEPDVSGVSYPAPPIQSVLNGEAAGGNGPSYQEPAQTTTINPGLYQPTPAPASSRRNGEKTPEELAGASSLVPAIQGSLLSFSPVPLQESSQPSAGNGSPAYGLSSGLPAQSAAVADHAASFADILSGALSSGSESSYDSQNMQSNKQSFYPGNASGGNNQTASGFFLADNTIWNGTVIPATLITGINTDLPGDVQARVSQNVYDSKTGKRLLIPQGSILIASYNSSVSFAQSRVQIVWNTLIRPDGFSVDLGGMNAVDSEGYSGVKGRYSENLFQYAKAMGIVSLFSVLNGQVSRSIDVDNNPAYRDLITANQNVVNQLGSRVIDKALDIQPIITVKNGAAINVMLNKHLQFPPVDDYEVTAKYVRR